MRQPVKQKRVFSSLTPMDKNGATSLASRPFHRVDYKPKSASVLSASGIEQWLTKFIHAEFADHFLCGRIGHEFAECQSHLHN